MSNQDNIDKTIDTVAAGVAVTAGAAGGAYLSFLPAILLAATPIGAIAGIAAGAAVGAAIVYNAISGDGEKKS